MLMKKNWKNRKGVSPVIATILMVAITVVLAAVLYVMVMGFGGDDGSNPPAGQIAKVEKTTVNNVEVYKLTLSSFSPSTKFTDLKVSGVDTSAIELIEFSSSTTLLSTEVYYVDLGGDGTVSQGDYLIISGLADSKDYVVSIVHSPSGGLIAETTISVTA